MKLLYRLVIVPLISSPSVGIAACNFLEGHSQKQIVVSIPPTISVPRDTTNGTTVYESPVQTFHGNASFKCTTDSKWGIKNSRGTDSPTSDIFPLGNSGLSWQWIYNNTTMTGAGSKNVKAGTYGHNNSTTVLRIVKTGNFQPGTSIDAGAIGYLQVDNIQTLELRINNNSSIASRSCETPDVKVEMGEFDLSSFTEYGKFTNSRAFRISLRNCPSGINKVSYSLTANPMAPAWNPDLGIIGLNQKSTAKGIALQILNSGLEPIQIGKTYNYTEYNSNGGSFFIPMNARYIRTLPNGHFGQHDQGMSAGTADTELTFIMSYL